MVAEMQELEMGMRMELPDMAGVLYGSGTIYGSGSPAGSSYQKQAGKNFSSAATRGGSLSYKVGDRVRHMKFGEGKVLRIVEGGRDFEVTVDFDRAGTKKMFASFAKLKKI